MLTVEQAVLALRNDPAMADLVRDSYLDEDVRTAARRFAASGEFAAVRELLGARLSRARVLDVGAGTGVASYAFATTGAAEVVSLEPDPSDVVGQRAIRRACTGLPVRVVAGWGEDLPFADATFDVIYARQVLHHARDVARVARECARVLRTGGVFLGCREHVADDARQLSEFLERHAVHRLAGGEHAHPLPVYRDAIRSAFANVTVHGPWDTVINAFPAVRSEAERRGVPAKLLVERFGAAGRLAAFLPGMSRLVFRRIDQPVGGRLYSFVAVR